MFDSEGGLVANAPHIPVHLGAMQEAVKYQIANSKFNPIKKGDVLLSNHPGCGGSHLVILKYFMTKIQNILKYIKSYFKPDLTVITPVFNKNEFPLFFVANRGHHADIGGISPGSMPPM